MVVLTKIARGNEANIPVLATGQEYLCLDTQNLFIGTNSGNKIVKCNQFLTTTKTTQAIPANTTTLITFNTGWNFNGSSFTCPYTANYLINCSITTTIVSNIVHTLGVNGIIDSGSSNSQFISLSFITQKNKNDVISIYLRSTKANTIQSGRLQICLI